MQTKMKWGGAVGIKLSLQRTPSVCLCQATLAFYNCCLKFIVSKPKKVRWSKHLDWSEVLATVVSIFCFSHFWFYIICLFQFPVFTFTIYYFRFSSLMPVVPCPSISMDLIVPWDQINWNYKMKKHPMESVLSCRSIATNFQLGEMDSGESEPPAPKFWFLLGFHPLYIENRGTTMKFWLGGGQILFFQTHLPPNCFLLGFWPLYFGNLELCKFFGKLFKNSCKNLNFWGDIPLRLLNWGDASPQSPVSVLSGLQCRLMASTGLRVDRRHTPRSCGYDVGCCRSKKQGVYIC